MTVPVFTITNVIEAIEVQLSPQRNKPFTIDEKIAEAAQNQFIQNFNRNCFYSNCSSIALPISSAGFCASISTFFNTPIPAIGIAVASFVLSYIWVNTRNQEGHTLDRALFIQDEDKIIRQLSLGANIHQEVWPFGGAAANLLPFVKGESRTVIQWFAKRGYSKVVAYLAMLEPNIEIRKQIAVDTLKHAKDKKTAQLLTDLADTLPSTARSQADSIIQNNSSEVTDECMDRDLYSTALELALFGTQYDHKGAEPKAVIISALCSKLIYNLVFGKKQQEHYWEPHVRNSFKIYEDDYKFKVNFGRHLFCSYSQEIFESHRDLKNLIEMTSDYFLKQMYGSDSLKSGVLDYFFKKTYDSDYDIKEELNYKLLAPFVDDLKNPSSNANAQYCLAFVYENGYGIEQNLDKAYKYYQLSADQGNIYAERYFSYYYDKGFRFNKNAENEGIKRHKFVNQSVIESDLFDSSNKKEELEVAKKNLIEARSNYCYKVLEGKNLSLKLTSYQWLKPFEKELSNPSANRVGQYCLAVIYKAGLGILLDLNKAFLYTKLSSDQGHIRGVLYLGHFYFEGKVVPKNIDLAFHFAKLAADQGDKVAQHNLAYCYEYETGTEKDLDLAFKYYKLSSDQGYATAQNKVGYYYQQGISVIKNLNRAVKYYKVAADQGEANAQAHLGWCYQNGLGVTENLNEAFKYYKLAAEQGHASAQNNLGCCYQHGFGVAQDLNEAFRYYNLAAEQGSKYAQNHVGECYENGIGTTQNLNEAFKYFKLSADQGFEKAEEKLKNFKYLNLSNNNTTSDKNFK